MPDFNTDCKIAGCERESVDSSGYCKKHKPSAPTAEPNCVVRNKEGQGTSLEYRHPVDLGQCKFCHQPSEKCWCFIKEIVSPPTADVEKIAREYAERQTDNQFRQREIVADLLPLFAQARAPLVAQIEELESFVLEIQERDG